MSNKPFTTSIFAVLILSLCSMPVLAEIGLELMQQYQSLHEVDAEYTHSSMTLVNKDGRERERIMQTYEKKSDSGENRSLLKFLSPSSINNVGLLTWQHSGETDDDQWLYLPASKQVKRIASAGKKNPFMGSDLSFEDMQAEDLQVHTYNVLGEEEIDGQLCWKIEALPATEKEARASAYGKRIIWLRQDITYPVKMEFYNHRDVLIKQASYEDIVPVENSVWRHNKSVMSTLQKATSTVILIDNRQVGLTIDENKFNQQALRRPPVLE